MFVFLKLRLFAVIWAPGTPARVHRALGAGPCSCLPCWPAHEACLVLVSAVPLPCVVLFSAGAHATALPPPGGLSAFRPGLQRGIPGRAAGHLELSDAASRMTSPRYAWAESPLQGAECNKPCFPAYLGVHVHHTSKRTLTCFSLFPFGIYFLLLPFLF